MQKNILFIGGGNMAEAIIGGLVTHQYPAEHIWVVDRNLSKREHLQKQYHVHVFESLAGCASKADIVILAVKPQAADTLCVDLQQCLQQKHPLIISIMAGVSVNSLETKLGAHLAIIRAMPNTPALVQAGATGFFGNQHVSTTDAKDAKHIFAAVGVVAELNSEAEIDVVTALSGSGPAYYFYFMEAMQDQAIAMGLAEETAKSFAIQTALGSAKLATTLGDDVVTLRKKVTSKNGTTAAALEVMQQQGLNKILAKSMNAAKNRAQELAKLS